MEKQAMVDQVCWLKQEKRDQANELGQLRRQLSGAVFIIAMKRSIEDPLPTNTRSATRKRVRKLQRKMDEVMFHSGLEVPSLLQAEEGWIAKRNSGTF